MKSAPVADHERIITIDVIRGFALFGIFLVNMPAFHSPVFMERPAETGMDFWLDLFFYLFVHNKFYTIFSFLFGLGFFIFMSRAEKKGLRVNRLFARRIGILFLLGLAHFILLWFGDILHTYAVAGLFLLFFYKRKLKTILIWAVSLLVLFYALLAAPFFIPEAQFEEMKTAMEQSNAVELENYIGVYEHAGYFEWVAYRFGQEVLPIMAKMPITAITVLGMFLLGLCAGKIGVFQLNTLHAPLIKKVWLTSMLLSVPLVAVVGAVKLSVLDFGLHQGVAVELFTGLSGFTLCFFYISSLTLLLRKASWQKHLRPLGYVGQMALTNYLSQTIICSFIFLVLDFYRNVSLVQGALLCLVIYAAQVVFSYYWLSHFKFGPFEWLWRSLTYGYFQSMKKTSLPEKEKTSKTI